MKHPTGVRRLDDLLGGGLPPGSFSLAYGPPFTGKDVLARLFALGGPSLAMPCIVVLTDESATEASTRLEAVDPRVPDFEKRGLLHYVDAYSRAIGAAGEIHPHTEYVDGPMNLNGLSIAVNTAQSRVIGEHAHHRLLFDSLSTLVTYTNPQTAFRFLQVLIGKSRRAGATGLLLLENGMHGEAEVTMMKHLVDGVLETRIDNGKNLVRIEGLGVTDHVGWVEYRFTGESFDVTGSFAAGRIK